jgi:hypothetical protein
MLSKLGSDEKVIAVLHVWAFKGRVHTKKTRTNLGDDFSSNYPPQNGGTKAVTNRRASRLYPTRIVQNLIFKTTKDSGDTVRSKMVIKKKH